MIEGGLVKGRKGQVRCGQELDHLGVGKAIWMCFCLFANVRVCKLSNFMCVCVVHVVCCCRMNRTDHQVF